MNCSFWTATGRSRTALVALVLAGLLAAGTACGNNDGPSAQVSIDSVSPQPTYAGVDTTVEFSIQPGEGVQQSDLRWKVDLGDGTTKNGKGASGSVTHDWSSSGSFSVKVSAQLDGTAIGSTSRRLQVLQPVDLAVSNVQGRPANVEGGESLVARFDVANQSATPVQTAFDASIFLRPTSAESPTAEDLAGSDPIGTGTIGANADVVVEAGGTRQARVTVTVPEELDSGEYNVVAWIQPEGQFADESPDNNFAVGSGIVRVDNVGGLLPDVDVDEVFVIPDRAYPALNEFQRGFTLANKGDTDATDVTTETYLSIGDKSIDEDDIMVNRAENAVENVPADSSRQIGPDEFVLSDDITAEMGEKTVYVIVKASLGSNSMEVTKDNNVGVSDPPITVTDMRADGPDVVVESFAVTPDTTYLGGSFEISAKISNQGNTDVSTFSCRLYLGENARIDIQNDQSFGSFNIVGLESGKSTTIQRTEQVTQVDASPGTYRPYVYCDPNGALDETFRGNNARLHSKDVEITSEPNLDLKIASINVPQSVRDGDKMTVSTEICVTGENASGRTQAKLWETAGQQVDFSKNAAETFQVPNINPGNCKTVDVEMTADCADFQQTYSYGARVDTRDDVDENDEMNNQATAGNTVQVQGQHCTCMEDQYEQNDRAQTSSTLQSPGQYSAGLCTAGECDYYDVALSKNESLRVETTFPADKDKLETTLYDPSGLTSLDKDTTDGRQRVATFSVPQSANYIFSVCAAGSSGRNLYDMDVSVLPQPNGVDLVPRKVELPTASTYSIGAKIRTSLRIHNIGTNASSGFEVDYVVTPDRKVGDGDDVPLTPSTVNVGGINPASRADTTDRLELPTSLSKGTYYIAATVDPTDQISEADENNNTSFSREITVQTRCYDPLEPNDSFSSATRVSSQTYNNLTACASEEDFYRLCPKDGKKFTVETTYNPQMGDIDLELYDRNKQLIDSSGNAGTGKETVSVDYVNGQQCYFVRPFLVTQQAQAETSYSMDVQVNNVAPSLQCTSHFEPNDSFSAATSLITALQQSQSGTIDRCPNSDEDFYALQLSQNQTVSLSGTISPNSQSGTLRLQLYKPNQTVTTFAETAPGVSTATISNYQAPTSGTYFLQVTVTSNDRNVTYELGAQGLGGIDLEAHNINIISRTYSPGETFWFNFDVSNLRSANATKPSYTIYFGDSQSLDRTNDTKLVTSTLSQDVSGNSTVTASEQITIPQGATSGTHYIHVEVTPDSSQTDPNDSNDVATHSISIQ